MIGKLDKLRTALREAVRGENLNDKRERDQASNIARVAAALSDAGFRQLESDEPAGDELLEDSFLIARFWMGRGRKPDELNVELYPANPNSELLFKLEKTPAGREAYARAERALDTLGFAYSRDVSGHLWSGWNVNLPDVPVLVSFEPAAEFSDFAGVSRLTDVTTARQEAHGVLAVRDDVTKAVYTMQRNGYVRKKLPGAADSQIMAKPGAYDRAGAVALVRAAIERSRRR